MYNRLEYRHNVPQSASLHNRLAKGTVWHFDAWLHGTGFALYIRIETRAGGRSGGKHNRHGFYSVSPLDGMLYEAPPQIGALQSFTLLDLSESERRAVRQATRRYVLPWAARVPAGFKARSVLLHYWPVFDLSPVPDNMLNYYVDGRGVKRS